MSAQRTVPSRALFPVALVLALIGLAATLAVVWGTGGVAQGAATLNVTTTADTTSCGTPCSLRGALAAASSGDSIAVPASTYTLLLGPELTIDKSLTLTGAGSGDTIIQVSSEPSVVSFRVLDITTGNVSISGVTIRHGFKPGLPGGGGVLNSGTLTLNDSTIAGNAAGGGATDGAGGGIHNRGTLSVVGSTIIRQPGPPGRHGHIQLRHPNSEQHAFH